jgi:hypothetical protein
VIIILAGCFTLLLIVLCVLCLKERAAIARTFPVPEEHSEPFTSEVASYTDPSPAGLLFFS